MKRILILLMCFGFFSVPMLVAQEQGDQDQRAARYILPGEGEGIQMQVNLWGQVQKPGIYRVPSDMDLISLISIAGGPTDLAKLSQVQVIRAYPDSGEARVIEVNVEGYLQRADVSEIPKLNPGDTIFLPGNFRRNFAEGLDVFGAIAGILSAIALIYERVVRAGSY